MSKVDYNSLFRDKAAVENGLRKICPQICHKSGIYFYTRQDKDGKHCYIGKAVDLIDRNITHCVSYSQHIDKSIKTRGFYSEDNPYGWKLNVLLFEKSELDYWERYYIRQYHNAGYHLYNIESGGTDGKTMIGERKPTKNYHDGLAQGRKSLAKELTHIINTHNFTIEPEKHNKVTEKALAKFWELLESESKDV